MRRFKTALLVVLTLAALVFFAFVPHIVSAILDGNTIGRVSLDPMVSPELKLRTDIPTLGKLAMLSQMDGTIALAEGKATMDREQVMEAVHEALAPYLDTHLATYSELDIEMFPHLVQIPEHLELQSIVWIVTIQGDPKAFTFFDLLIDDETGQLLRISYVTENGMFHLSAEDVLTHFEEIYFSGLGLSDYSVYWGADMAPVNPGDSGTGRRYVFTSDKYGEIPVDLYVYDYGFYVEFPLSNVDRFSAEWAGPYG